MTSTSFVHVVAKADISDHTVVETSTSSLQPLQEGHVRIRVKLASVENNNLSLALLGSVRHWWDTYPVPSTLKAPFNDRDRYGVCPVWGYGEVVDSAVPSIENGTLFWGFWPSSDLPVDLKLVPADVKGHWIEISEHRKALGNLYQRYMQQNSSLQIQSLDQTELKQLAWEAAYRPQWDAGHLLNCAVFGNPPVHPANDGKWDESDADLSSAVVISLSASGKTARAFTDCLVNLRSPGTGPLGLLAVTSDASGQLVPKACFSTLTVSYQNMLDKETFKWIGDRQPRKIVITDFGGRGDSLHSLLEGLEQHFGSSLEVAVIGIGGNPHMHRPEQFGEFFQKRAGLVNNVQMSTTDIRDAAMKHLGSAKYFEDVASAWSKFSQSQSASSGDLKVELGEGVHGDHGFEGGWTKLCDGNASAHVALAYLF